MNLLTMIPGKGGLEKTLLISPDGAQAEVYLHGGQLTSWIPKAGGEQIYLSPKSEYAPQAAIRGGVPVIFPQFSSFGPLRKHGFARIMDWQVHGVETQNDLVTATFILDDTPETLREWDYPFQLELAITLGGNRIYLTLSITNTGLAAFRFTAALHTYLSVSDIANVQVAGLRNQVYADHTDGGFEKIQPEDLLRIEGEIDQVYYNPRPVLTLHDNEKTLQIGKKGFSDCVIWNPGPILSSTMPDLGQEAFRSFLCIESAQVTKPIRLSPEESWQGVQTLTVNK